MERCSSNRCTRQPKLSSQALVLDLSNPEHKSILRVVLSMVVEEVSLVSESFLQGNKCLLIFEFLDD